MEKTSVVEALANCLDDMFKCNKFVSESPRHQQEILQTDKRRGYGATWVEEAPKGLAIQFNQIENGTFILEEEQCYN